MTEQETRAKILASRFDSAIRQAEFMAQALEDLVKAAEPMREALQHSMLSNLEHLANLATSVAAGLRHATRSI